MRKLAREATIFALLGFLVVMVGCFVVIERNSRVNVELEAAAAVHAVLPDPANPPASGSVPIDTVEVPLMNGTVLHARRCAPRFVPISPPTSQAQKPVGQLRPFTTNPLPLRSLGYTSDCRYFSNSYYELERKLGGRLSVPLGSADQVAIEKDYWAAYSKARRRNLGIGMGSLALSLWGFPAGLGIWAFYRLVRFAIKG